MYDNNRNGIIDEYTDKLGAEAGCGIAYPSAADALKLRFIRGLVSDIVDRIAEDPTKFGAKVSGTIDLDDRVRSILENVADVSDAFRLEEIAKVVK
jgi:hypothetical protein